MEASITNDYSAREYVGCVSDDDIQRIFIQYGSGDLDDLADSSLFYPEERQQWQAWHHFTSGCICRRLHDECDPETCPGRLDEVVQAATSGQSMQKPDLLKGVTFQQLQSSSRARCWFCSIICNGVDSALKRLSTKSWQGDQHDQLQIRAEKPQDKDLGRPFLKIALIFRKEQGMAIYEFYRQEGQGGGQPCACFRTAPEIPVSTALAESFIFAKCQMARCVKNLGESHIHCESGIVKLPTRVLEITELNGKYCVHLLITNGLRGRYVTLSHCWGSKVQTTTSTINLDQRQAGIPWDALSRTFRDAIHITHRLGFRFLWIDALCILQGDLQDWQRESAQMHKIYQDCALMISADKAQDGEDGCFSNMGTGSWLVRSTLHEASIAVRQTRYHSGVHGPNRTERHPQFAPLSRRAWAFQERTLARKILHYTYDELIWECGGMYTCQCGDIGADFGSNAHKFLFQDCEMNDYFINTVWHGLIADYSARLLTKPEDRLPAYSGLAKNYENTWNRLTDMYTHADSNVAEQHLIVADSTKTVKPIEIADSTGTANPAATADLTEMANSTDSPLQKSLGTYLAGLWSNHLDSGLLWARLVPNPSLAPKSPQYIAPSWSWASTISAVHYLQARAKASNIKIKAASCTPAGLDPTGAVAGGYLILSGPVIKLSLRCARPSSSEKETARGYEILCDYVGRDVSGNYAPDYLLESGTKDDAAANILTLYGLAMSPDFVMVLKESEPELYERIGSLTFLPYAMFELHNQPHEWKKDAMETTLKII